MAYGTGLENRRGLKPSVSSNLTASAKTKKRLQIKKSDSSRVGLFFSLSELTMVNESLDVYIAKTKKHLDQADALINAAKTAGKRGEAFVTIAQAAAEDPYFQANHVPKKYEGMGESAYIYWSFLGELNHAFFDDGEISFVSAHMCDEVRFAFIVFEHHGDVQKKLNDPCFILNRCIAEEIDAVNARSEMLKRCGSLSEPTFNVDDYQLKVHTDPEVFCKELKSFAERDIL